jgi:VanZ family protein
MVQMTIRGFRLATILLTTYWCLLFIATHIPKPPSLHVQHIDKVFHFAAYAGLAFLLAWSLPTIPNHPLLNVLLAAFVSISYGVVDECLQIPVGRTADILDWIADSIGAVSGLCAYAVLRCWLMKRGKSQPTRRTTTLEALPG